MCVCGIYFHFAPDPIKGFINRGFYPIKWGSRIESCRIYHIGRVPWESLSPAPCFTLRRKCVIQTLFELWEAVTTSLGTMCWWPATREEPCPNNRFKLPWCMSYHWSCTSNCRLGCFKFGWHLTSWVKIAQYYVGGILLLTGSMWGRHNLAKDGCFSWISDTR